MNERIQVGLFPTISRVPGVALRCAHEVRLHNFVGISTDKAAVASSEPGQTKRLAEQLIAESGRDDIKVKFTGRRTGEKLHSTSQVRAALDWYCDEAS